MTKPELDLTGLYVEEQLSELSNYLRDITGHKGKCPSDLGYSKIDNGDIDMLADAIDSILIDRDKDLNY